MSYENRKKQRLKKRRIRNIIVMGAFCILTIGTIYGVLSKNPRVTLPKEEQFIVTMKSQSVHIKDEKVYTISIDTKLNPKIEEGKRVPQGYEVGIVDIVKDINSLNEELKEINKAIEVLNLGNSDSKFFKNDKESLESAQKTLVDKIQQSINNSEFTEIDNLKNQMIFNNKKLDDISMDSTLLSQSIGELEFRKEVILEEINNNSTNYYTQQSGIISFEIDGYEGIYIPKEFENYTYDKIQIPKENSKALESKGNKEINKYKIIKNFDWYLAIKIDNIYDMEDFELNDTINLKIEGNDRSLVGRIIAINYLDEKAVYVVKFDAYLHDYYDTRFPSVEIMLEKKDAYLIPTESIFTKDNQKGVFVKEFNGIVRFRPIEIFGEEDGHTFISKGNENGFINVKSQKPVKTISLYDEVLLNPLNFSEGDILIKSRR